MCLSEKEDYLSYRDSGGGGRSGNTRGKMKVEIRVIWPQAKEFLQNLGEARKVSLP